MGKTNGHTKHDAATVKAATTKTTTTGKVVAPKIPSGGGGGGKVNFNFKYDTVNHILTWDRIPGADSYTIYHADGLIEGPPPAPIPPPPIDPPWSVLCSNIIITSYPVPPTEIKHWVCGRVNPSGSWGSPSPIDPHNP